MNGTSVDIRVLGLFGPSGAGKTTLARSLPRLWPDRYEQLMTISTREPRDDDGGSYMTVSAADFADLERAGAFMATTRIDSESEDRLYGYRHADMAGAAERRRIVVVPVERQLTEGLRAALRPEDLLIIGLLPPGRSRDEQLAVLEARLTPRHAGRSKELADRLRNARDLDLPLMETARSPGSLLDAVVITSGSEEETAALIHRMCGERWGSQDTG